MIEFFVFAIQLFFGMEAHLLFFHMHITHDWLCIGIDPRLIYFPWEDNKVGNFDVIAVGHYDVIVYRLE